MLTAAHRFTLREERQSAAAAAAFAGTAERAGDLLDDLLGRRDEVEPIRDEDEQPVRLAVACGGSKRQALDQWSHWKAAV